MAFSWSQRSLAQKTTSAAVTSVLVPIQKKAAYSPRAG
jgi:hypothetical protein